MSSGPSGPQGPQNGGAPNYLPTPSMPGMGTYGAGYQSPQGTNIGYANVAPYQQGLTPGQIQQGLGKLNNGMGMAAQSYNKMGQMGCMFMQNANNAGNAAYNPAIGAYQQALNQNSQNIGAQLASQRGASVDPGLAARNVGQAGAIAAQNAAGQMSSQVAQYKLGNQQAAAGAYQGQGQMAGIYGNIANAYAQAGLANQGQILNAIAAQNAANVAMQSNVNSSNVAMQSNINSANVAMQSNVNDVMAQQMMNNNNLAMQGYGMQLGYNANLYNSFAGIQGSQYAGSKSGGLFGGGGFLGLGFSLSKGGEVGKHGKPKVIETTGRTLTAKQAAFAKRLAKVPQFANGGRIPEPKRIAMAQGGMVKKYDDGGAVCGSASDQKTDMQDQSLSSMGGGPQSPYSLGTNLNLMQALQQNDSNVMNQSSAGPQAPASTTGKILSGLLQQQRPQIHGGGGGGGCMIGGAVLGGGISALQGGSFLGGAGASMGIGGAGAAGAGAGAGDAAALAAAAHGGRISKIAKPMARAPHVGMAAPHLARGGMPSHVTVPVAALRKIMDMAHVGKQAMQQRAMGGYAGGGPVRGRVPGSGMHLLGNAPPLPNSGFSIGSGNRGQRTGPMPPIRAAQGAIIPQTQNPNMPGSMTPNIAMQSNINGAQGSQGAQGPGQGFQGQQQIPNGQGNVQAQGPSMSNFALAGSPNPNVAMPSTGLPMGNAQTNGQGMPGIGMSSNVDPYGRRRPGQPYARGGMVNGRRT